MALYTISWFLQGGQGSTDVSWIDFSPYQNSWQYDGLHSHFKFGTGLCSEFFNESPYGGQFVLLCNQTMHLFPYTYVDIPLMFGTSSSYLVNLRFTVMPSSITFKF